MAPSKSETRPINATLTGTPELHVIKHADGFGWQVSATQSWIEREEQIEREYWEGLLYRPAPSLKEHRTLFFKTIIPAERPPETGRKDPPHEEEACGG